MTRARDLADLGDGIATADLPDITADKLDVGQIGGRRNLIINGAMQVAQRGTSTSSVTSGGFYACDRWAWYANTSDAVTISQVTDAPNGYSNSLKVEVTTSASLSSGSQTRLEQRVEAQNLQHLKYNTSAAETLTLSFWVKSAQTGVHIAALNQSDASTNTHISATYTVSSANTWEYKTVSFVGNTGEAIANDNGLGLRVMFVLASGTDFTSGSNNAWGTSANQAPNIANNFLDTIGNTFQITGVQLEVGSVATPFEHRSYGEELALCQRYYTKSYGQGVNPGTATIDGSVGRHGVAGTGTTGEMFTSTVFKVEMRGVPTVLAYDTSGNSAKCNVTDFGVADYNNQTCNEVHIQTSGCHFQRPSGSSGCAITVHYTADAEL